MHFFYECADDFLIFVYRFEKKNYFCREIKCCIAKKVVTCNPISCRRTQGKMLEWLKRHAWKACIRQKRIGGSNPPLSADIE